MKKPKFNHGRPPLCGSPISREHFRRTSGSVLHGSTRISKSSELGARRSEIGKVCFLLSTFYFLLCAAAQLHAQNVKVVNPDSSPAAVKVISGGLVNSADPHVVSVPGATPSPSPVKAVNVQTVGGAVVTVHPDGTPAPVKIDQTTAGSTNATQPKQYTGAPSTATPATADATVFTLAAGEIGFIQNLSADAPLAVKKGASASTSSFNFVLAAGSAADDGKGGAVRIDDWVGAVSVAKITGTARYIAWKQAP